MGISAPRVEHGQVVIEFGSFELDCYPLFLRTKQLPDSRIAYDWQRDVYTVTAPERYAGFLGAQLSQFTSSEMPLAQYLWDYERFIVEQALKAKRYAIFADCGLGKTPMFLEWARHVCQRTSGKVLILTFKNIAPETLEQRDKFYGSSLPITRLETREELIEWLNPNKGETNGSQSEVQSNEHHGARISRQDDNLAGDLRCDNSRGPKLCASNAQRKAGDVRQQSKGRRAISDGPVLLSGHHASPQPAIGIVNYEKFIAGQIPELRNLAGLVADESSILKSGGGVIKWNLIKSARGIEYKLSCTATPAPNDVMEYASQAAFLEKLRSEGEILWTFFRRTKEGEWYIMPHAKEAFYRFMASWSIYFRNPASYGFKDNVKPVPTPIFIEHRVPMTEAQGIEAQKLFQSSGAGLFGDKALGIRERSKLSQLAKGFLYEGDDVRRFTSVKPRFTAELIEQEVAAGNQTLVWTVFDEESAILAKAIPHLQPRIFDGDTSDEEREQMVRDFKAKKFMVLISKASMLGFGQNFPQIGAMIFSGWDDSYERFYQGVKRGARYGQTKKLRVHIPFIPELEGPILENLMRKKDNFERDAELQEHYYREALGRLPQ